MSFRDLYTILPCTQPDRASKREIEYRPVTISASVPTYGIGLGNVAN